MKPELVYHLAQQLAKQVAQHVEPNAVPCEAVVKFKCSNCNVISSRDSSSSRVTACTPFCHRRYVTSHHEHVSTIHRHVYFVTLIGLYGCHDLYLSGPVSCASTSCMLFASGVFLRTVTDRIIRGATSIFRMRSGAEITACFSAAFDIMYVCFMCTPNVQRLFKCELIVTA